MLVVKIMSSENLPDSDPYKGFTLIPIPDNQKVFFNEADSRDPATVIVVDTDGNVVNRCMIYGNVYVMQDGKTIATFSARSGASSKLNHA